MRASLVFILLTVFSLSSFAAKVGSSAKRGAQRERLNTPKAAIATLQFSSSRWIAISAMSGHVSPADYQGMRRLADQLGVNLRAKWNIKITGENEFILTDSNTKVKFSVDARTMYVNGTPMQLSKKLSFIENYKSITGKLSAAKSSAGLLNWLFMGTAHAGDIPENQSLGYDLATLFYYTEQFSDSDGEIMQDFYNKEPKLQEIKKRLGGKNLSATLTCNENGMIAKFNNGTTAYIGNDGDISEKQKGGKLAKVAVSDTGMGGSAVNYYCRMLQSGEGYTGNEKVEVEALLPNGIAQ